MDAKERFSMARTIGMRCWPFTATALLNLSPRWTDAVPRVAVDPKYRVYLNPKWVEATPVTTLALILVAHECQHLVLEHSVRFKGADPDKANYAGDLAINSKLREWCEAAAAQQREMNRNVTSPSPPFEFVPPPHPHAAYAEHTKGRDGQPLVPGLLAEEYYAALPEIEVVTFSVSGRGKGGKGPGQDQPGDGGERPPGCDCGSGAGGRPVPGEDQSDADAVGPAEAAVIARAVAEATVDQASRLPGTVPGGFLRECRRRLRPPIVQWQQRLKAAVRAMTAVSRGSQDFTYTRPHPRFTQGPVLLPARIDTKPVVRAAIDTSGSMTAEDLVRVMSETVGLVNHLQGVGVETLVVDAAVHDRVVVKNREDVVRLAERLEGGGGTDMGVGLDAMSELRPPTGTAIVFTDGYTPWPEFKPANIGNVLVVLTRPANTSYPTPDWASCVEAFDPAETD